MRETAIPGAKLALESVRERAVRVKRFLESRAEVRWVPMLPLAPTMAIFLRGERGIVVVKGICCLMRVWTAKYWAFSAVGVYVVKEGLILRAFLLS
jgi:hypothetical protein